MMDFEAFFIISRLLFAILSVLSESVGGTIPNDRDPYQVSVGGTLPNDGIPYQSTLPLTTEQIELGSHLNMGAQLQIPNANYVLKRSDHSVFYRELLALQILSSLPFAPRLYDFYSPDISQGGYLVVEDVGRCPLTIVTIQSDVKQHLVAGMVAILLRMHLMGVAHGRLSMDAFCLTDKGHLRLTNYQDAAFLETSDNERIGSMLFSEYEDNLVVDWHGLAAVIEKLDCGLGIDLVILLLKQDIVIDHIAEVLKMMPYFSGVNWKEHLDFTAAPPVGLAKRHVERYSARL
jgi:hypothetical protein